MYENLGIATSVYDKRLHLHYVGSGLILTREKLDTFNIHLYAVNSFSNILNVIIDITHHCPALLIFLLEKHFSVYGSHGAEYHLKIEV